MTPTDWKPGFDRAGVSRWPSVGYWNLPSRSHDVIRDVGKRSSSLKNCTRIDH
ncbi:hypothetical protein [Burkholderia sp. Ac-20353]|uniref:hypothetical protein n=1 Tax=Burkholderia sp. Ac-20353 TaxID=2703894 RepID=UPI00321790C0